MEPVPREASHLVRPRALAFPSFLEPASWGNGTHRDGRVAYISRFLSFLRP